MPDSLLIGLDLGTTVLKAAAFERGSGTLLAGASQRLPVEVGEDGRRETDLKALDGALEAVMGSLRQQVGGAWPRVSGLGLSAQGGSTLIVRRDSGEPLTPMIHWNDGRAYPHLQEMMSQRPASYWRAFSRRDEPGMGLARLRWLRETRPDLLCESSLYVGAGEYALHRLTGEWRQDACNALQTGCYDARRWELTPEPLAELGVALSFVAPLRRGHETLPLTAEAASRWGLRPGLPVAGPYNDHEAAYLCSAQVSPRPLQCSLGTAWVATFRLPDSVEGGSPFQLVIPAPLGEGRLVIQPLLTGNVTWDWALEAWVHPSRERALELQRQLFEEQLLPPHGLVMLPWLNRPHLFETGVLGAGCVVGLSPTTRAGDLARAAAAGMAYELARVVEEVTARGEVDGVVLAGGASKGRHFQQLLSTLFEPLPVRLMVEQDWMGARGCLYTFGGSAARGGTLEAPPAPDREALQRGRRLYLQTWERLYGSVRAGQAFRLGGV